MRSDVNAVTESDIPDMFCWTKYGTEAGQEAATILARKEAERRQNGGIFLWGIGNAIGPSIQYLLEKIPLPQVVFTPMLSKPAMRDRAPERIAVWRGGVGLDGDRCELPAHSIVTSRASASGRAHYALVCKSDVPLAANTSTRASFTTAHVQNLRSGSRVGASQVTSVVRRIPRGLGLLPSSYEVSFTADLVAPYLIRLTDCTYVDDNLSESCGAD